MSDKTAMQKNSKPSGKLENIKHWLTLWWVRALLLIGGALGGIPFSEYTSCLLVDWVDHELATSVQLKILLLSLPVLCLLWYFRTTDTREHIQKAQENAEAARDALNADTLGRYLAMLFSKELSSRCVGLIRLADIKRQGNYVEEIDIATRQNLDLTQANLKGENLSGVNLEGAILSEANLCEKADLSDANLRHTMMHKTLLLKTILVGADLRWAKAPQADFMGADLSGAKLQNADLSTAKNLEHATLKGAEFHPYGTKFPKFFGDPVTRGMIRVNEPFSNL